jgi:hypothetical protein
MNTDTSPAAGNGDAAEEPIPPRARRRKNAIDEPVRPLGPKAALLHARRVSRKATAPDAAAPDDAALASEDGAVSFVLAGTSGGLFIERTQRRPLGAQLVQAIVFGEMSAFRRWCDADPIRFDYPVLHGRLRSQGHDYFGARS